MVVLTPSGPAHRNARGTVRFGLQMEKQLRRLLIILLLLRLLCFLSLLFSNILHPTHAVGTFLRFIVAINLYVNLYLYFSPTNFSIGNHFEFH